MQRRFQKRVENFVCEECGAFVTGNGFTNHCPNCLISKHVDVNPGDRASNCGGLMRPISFEIKSAKYVLTQRCMKCGFERRNKLQDGDNVDALMSISKKGIWSET